MSIGRQKDNLGKGKNGKEHDVGAITYFSVYGLFFVLWKAKVYGELNTCQLHINQSFRVKL